MKQLITPLALYVLYMLKQLITPIALYVLWLAAIIGWCMNIWNIVDSAAVVGGSLNAMLVARCVGAFVVPLGAILGYF